jgi:hypothetical protein
VQKLSKQSHITGDRREVLANEISPKYLAGASIRALADEYGRSYGFVHRLIQETGTTLRPRGGSRGR